MCLPFWECGLFYGILFKKDSYSAKQTEAEVK